MVIETVERSETTEVATSKGDLVQFQPPRLPWHDAVRDRFGVDRAGWKTLTDAIFPSARSVDSIVLALSYCRARKLDIFKRPVHIVPMWDSKRGGYVETIWPGIGELRTTAFRTGQYAGCDEAEFGPETEATFTGRVKSGNEWIDKSVTVKFPTWCRVTVYRELAGRCKFVGPKVYWLESYATIGNTDLPNEMWAGRASGQIEKVAEAGALRKAFPEETGDMATAEEMEGRRLIDDVAPRMPPSPDAMIEREPPRPAAAAKPGLRPPSPDDAKDEIGKARKRKAKAEAETPSDHDAVTGEVLSQTAGHSDEDKDEREAKLTNDLRDSLELEKKKIARLPDTAGEYIVYAEWWISQLGNIAIGERRWSEEAEMRDRLAVPIRDRNELRAKLDHIAERLSR